MTDTQTAAKWTAELVRARVSDPAGAEPIANVLNNNGALAAENARLRAALQGAYNELGLMATVAVNKGVFTAAEGAQLYDGWQYIRAALEAA